MCCGEYDGLGAALAAPVRGDVMAKVFTTVKGAVLQIGNYGPASNDAPAIVPEEVAEELSGQTDFRVEREAAAPPAPKKKGREA